MKGKSTTEDPWPIPERKLPKKAAGTAATAAPKTTAASPPPGVSKIPEELKRPALIGAAVTLAIFIIAMLLWFVNRPAAPEPGTAAGGSAADLTAPAAGPASDGTTLKTVPGLKLSKTGPIIAAVLINPTQPIATDTLKASATLASSGDETAVTFSYQWKLNDRLLPRATADILKDVSLKRRDRISVVATAFRDGIAGPPAESQTVVIYSLPPSLEMNIISPQVSPGQPAEIQLTGASPDGDRLTFSLISPYVEGMTIDAGTGKILWTPRRMLQGKLPFGAAVTDTDGNKTMKVFELDLGVAKAP